MTDDDFLADLVVEYRRRRAPAQLAGRIASAAAARRTRAVQPGRPSLPVGKRFRWLLPALATVSLLIAVAIPVGLLDRLRGAPDEPASDFLVMPVLPGGALVTGGISVPGLSAIGEVPFFPALPAFDMHGVPDASPPTEERRGAAPTIEFARTVQGDFHDQA